jgi:hypothetical protein
MLSYSHKLTTFYVFVFSKNSNYLLNEFKINTRAQAQDQSSGD